MTPAPSPRLVSFDEAGFTGPKMLDEDQPVFVYASHDLMPEEASALVAALRVAHRVQGSELKAGLLRKRANWPEIAAEAMRAVEGRAIVIACDKRLNLGGKAFEYLFEPLLSENCGLFYAHNLHRFVMNALYAALYRHGTPPHQAAVELQAFLRTFDPADAPGLFGGGLDPAASEALEAVLRFVRGYAGRIAAATAHLRAGADPQAKWTLELSTTALYSLAFMGWSHRHDRIELLCDASKPLEALARVFDRWVGRDVSAEISDGRRSEPFRGCLASPIRFGSSADHPTIQIADVLAGATADAIRHVGDPTYRELHAWVDRHMHPNVLMPDPGMIDMRRPEARANLAVLQELARRAEAGADPLAGMTAFYATTLARVSPPRTIGDLTPRRRADR